MKTIFRGLIRMLATLFFITLGMTILLGPILLVDAYHNAKFLVLYSPHLLLALYLMGEEE